MDYDRFFPTNDPDRPLLEAGLDFLSQGMELLVSRRQTCGWRPPGRPVMVSMDYDEARHLAERLRRYFYFRRSPTELVITPELAREPDPIEEGRTYSVAEVSERLGRHHVTIYNWIKDGLISATRKGGSGPWRVLHDEAFERLLWEMEHIEWGRTHLTTTEVAARAGCDHQTVYNAIRDGRITGTRVTMGPNGWPCHAVVVDDALHRFMGLMYAQVIELTEPYYTFGEIAELAGCVYSTVYTKVDASFPLTQVEQAGQPVTAVVTGERLARFFDEAFNVRAIVALDEDAEARRDELIPRSYAA